MSYLSIVENGLPKIYIITQQTAVARFAGEEFQKYIKLISGCELPLRSEAEAKRLSLWIGTTEWANAKYPGLCATDKLKYDGFCIKTVKDGILLTGNMDRALLYAVYELLRHVGCRWFFPGESGEVLPQKNDIYIDEINLLENPAYEVRGFTEGTLKDPADVWLGEMLEFVDWSAKNKINSVFIHDYPFRQVEGLGEIMSEVKKRGMIFEFGGHGIHTCVDRSLFEEKPELFRVKKGERRKDGNFCASNEEAVKMLSRGALSVLERMPDLDVLQLFFDDSYGGSWCECEKCKDLPPAEQQIISMNAIARELSKKSERVKTCMTLYHDTIFSGDIRTPPESNLMGLYAPRERCYSHSIGDKTCPRNVFYYERLKETVEKFAGNSYIFEYYNDIILYRKMKIHLPHIIIEDLKDYANAGVNKITSLMFGRYSWWAYELNMLVYARAAWNSEYDYSEELRDFCGSLFGETGSDMICYYTLLEKAALGLLTFCEYRDKLTDLRDIPPQAYDFYEKHIDGIRQSAELFKKGLKIVNRLSGVCEGDRLARLKREKTILEISINEALAVYHEMLGKYVYRKNGKVDLEFLETNLVKAKYHLRKTLALIENIPFNVKGNAGGTSLFVKDITESQIESLDSYLNKAHAYYKAQNPYS